MKNFEAYTGGHPLRLDNGLLMQAGYKEAILALARSFVPPSVTVAFLQGGAISEDGGETSITDGWMLIGSDVYRIPAKTVGVTGLGNLKLVLVTDTPVGYPSTVTYRDTGPQEVYKETILDFRTTDDPDGEGSPIELDTYVYRVAAKPKRTIEMFSPSDALSNYFDASSGIGKGDCLGYALCDGQDGRPNLKGKFVVGYDSADSDYNTIGKLGGSKAHTLQVSEMPAHRHSLNSTLIEKAGNTTEIAVVNNNDDTATGDQIFPTKINETGGNQPHENRPPFYTVVYMIKL